MGNAEALRSTPSAPSPQASRAARDGEVLARRFRVVELLGEGAFGEVYEAEDLELGERVAIKVLHRELARDAQARERFKREIALARQVTHPNICRLFDLFVDRRPGGGMAFVTMELLRGETLAERLARGRLDAGEALPLVRQMAAALAAAHAAGIVHRDFKSANVLLVPGAGGTRAVVTDFGTARLGDGATASRLTARGEIVGAPAYMAPEQVRGEPAQAAADIYALGVVMYEMATGTLPFLGPTAFETALLRLHERPRRLRELMPSIDPRWEAAILRCLEPDPRHRFASAAEVARALPGEAAAPRAAWGGRLARWDTARRLARPGAGPADAGRTALRGVIGYGARAVASLVRHLAGWAAPLRAAGLALVLLWPLADARREPIAPREAAAPVPASAAGLLTEGAARLARFDAAGARDLLLAARTAAPDDPRIRAALAGAWSALGDERLAREEARQAFVLSADLPPEEVRRIEAAHRAAERDWEGAARLYAALAARAPLDLELALQLARARTEAGQAQLALSGIERLRQSAPGVAADPRLDLAEAQAAAALSDFMGQRAAAARAAAKAARRQEPSLLAAARVSEGQALQSLAEPERALAGFREAARLYAATGDRLGATRARHAMAEVLRTGGDPGRARALLLAALAAYRGLGARGGEQQALRDLGQVALDAGELPRARRLFEQALAIASELDDKVEVVRLLGALGSVLRQQGDLDAARGRFAEALARSRAIGNRAEEWRAVNSLAFTLQIQGDFAGAERTLRQAISSFRGLADRRMEVAAVSNLGLVLAAQGRLVEARARQDQALASYDAMGNERGRAETLYRLAELDRWQGRLPAARARYEEAQALRRAAGDELRAAICALGLAKLDLDQGEDGAAARRAAEAAAVFATAEARDFQAEALATEAAARSAAGDRAEATRLIAAAAALAQASDDQTVTLYVAMRSAEIAARAGRPGAGIEGLRAALRAGKAAGRPLRLEGRLALLRLELAAGGGEDARNRLDALSREAAAGGFELVARRAGEARRPAG